MNKLRVSIARSIREARQAKGLSQIQLAKKLRTTQSAVARWESKAPSAASLSLTKLEGIGKAMGLETRVFMSPLNAHARNRSTGVVTTRVGWPQKGQDE